VGTAGVLMHLRLQQLPAVLLCCTVLNEQKRKRVRAGGEYGGQDEDDTEEGDQSTLIWIWVLEGRCSVGRSAQCGMAAMLRDGMQRARHGLAGSGVATDGPRGCTSCRLHGMLGVLAVDSHLCLVQSLQCAQVNYYSNSRNSRPID
jgi:hypothetical protein